MMPTITAADEKCGSVAEPGSCRHERGKCPVRFRLLVIALLFGHCLVHGLSTCACAQDAKFHPSRKIVRREEPKYPPAALRLNLTGTVKLAVSVAGDGTAKSVDTLGGHPLLTEAASKAVAKWKWEPAGHDSVESVEIIFGPR
jgi:TonB family protein